MSSFMVQPVQFVLGREVEEDGFSSRGGEGQHHFCKPLPTSPQASTTDDETTVCSSLPESEVSPFDEDLSSSACSLRSLDFGHSPQGGSNLSLDHHKGRFDLLNAIGGGGVARRQRTAHDIRRHYACKLGIRHPRVEVQQLLPSWSRASCLPEGVRPVVEKLKGRQESYGGFLRLMRRKSEVGAALETSSSSSRCAVTLSESGPSAAGSMMMSGSIKSNMNNNGFGAAAGGGVGGGTSSSPSAGAACNESSLLSGETSMRRLSISSSSSSTSDGVDGGGGDFSSSSSSPPKRGVSRNLLPRRSCLKQHQEAGGPLTRSNSRGGVGLRRIAFLEEVEVVHIPNHADFSYRVKAQYWSNPEEIYEMACRNLVEYQAEGYDYESAVEEDQMFYVPETGELIHPAHVDLSYNGPPPPSDGASPSSSSA